MSRFRRRLMGLAALRQAMKDDFVRVEYLENVSNAYIDTKVFPNNNTNVEIRGTISTTKQYIFGARTAAYNRAFGFYGIDNTNKARWDYGNKLVNGDFALDINVIYQISNNKNVITVYDESTETSNSITAANNTFTCQYTMYYFGVNQKNVLAATTKGKLYYLKIYNGEELIRDYIPMYQISTDTYGLWDRVTEEFYTSPNGVKFNGGARVVADADDNLYYIKNYISSNNNINAYITLRKFHNTDNVEFEIYKKQNADSWFGSRQGSPARNLFALNAYGGGININWGQQSPTRIVNNIANDRKHKVRLWNREVFVNGTKVYTCGTNTFTTNSNVTLGKVDGITSVASNCNWYYFKWWDANKDLVYDLIPVQSVDSGKYGMFDKVSLVFHTSNGSANFIGG